MCSKVGASLRLAWGLPVSVGWSGERAALPEIATNTGHNGIAVDSTTKSPSTTSPREDAANDDFWVFLASFQQRHRRHHLRHLDDVAASPSTSTGCSRVRQQFSVWGLLLGLLGCHEDFQLIFPTYDKAIGELVLVGFESHSPGGSPRQQQQKRNTAATADI